MRALNAGNVRATAVARCGTSRCTTAIPGGKLAQKGLGASVGLCCFYSETSRKGTRAIRDRRSWVPLFQIFAGQDPPFLQKMAAYQSEDWIHFRKWNPSRGTLVFVIFVGVLTCPLFHWWLDPCLLCSPCWWHRCYNNYSISVIPTISHEWTILWDQPPAPRKASEGSCSAVSTATPQRRRGILGDLWGCLVMSSGGAWWKYVGANNF